MSEYSEVEQPFLQQLAEQGWTVIDQGTGVPQDAALSLRDNFRQQGRRVTGCSFYQGHRLPQGLLPGEWRLALSLEMPDGTADHHRLHRRA